MLFQIIKNMEAKEYMYCDWEIYLISDTISPSLNHNNLWNSNDIDLFH